MPSLVPHPFLFRLRFDVQPATAVTAAALLQELDETYLLREPHSLSGPSAFAAMYAGWNPEGLGIVLRVRGLKQPPTASPDAVGDSDGLRLWVGTRATANIHRANRFCHHFVACPVGAGKRKQDAFLTQFPLSRAKEDSPTLEVVAEPPVSDLQKNGYDLGVWLPAVLLHGFDPGNSPQLSFYYEVVDSQLGRQLLGVGGDFPYASDPSLWGTLQLKSAAKPAPKRRRKAARPRPS